MSHRPQVLDAASENQLQTHTASNDSLESEPREKTGANGTLIVGREFPAHSKDSVRELVLQPLMDVVGQTTLWARCAGNLEERMGDFRFLILEFKHPDDVLTFVQIWSEPTGELTMEVGPGKRSEWRLQAFADGPSHSLAKQGLW